MTKETLDALLGPLPETCDLNPSILESIDCGSYTRFKVAYDTEPGERISAFLLVPKDLVAPAPAVFCYHQHASNFDLGKSEVVGLSGDRDRACAAELAERGYISFAPDALGFEERNWSPGSNVAYHELATRRVRGTTLLAKILHDVSIGVDYLLDHPDVDGWRIGFIGHSYGGRVALGTHIRQAHYGFRIALRMHRSTRLAFARCRHTTRVLRPSLSRTRRPRDVVALCEPAAILISATDDDTWSRGARKLFDYARPAFERGSLQLNEWASKHAFTTEMRTAAYEFLDRHLKRDTDT